jgi:hypothetical protein
MCDGHVGELVGIVHTGRGGGAKQGGTNGDTPRQRRDDGAERLARDGGILVEGSSGDH